MFGKKKEKKIKGGSEWKFDDFFWIKRKFDFTKNEFEISLKLSKLNEIINKIIIHTFEF